MAGERYRVLHLDDVESLPGPDTLTWRPVRAALGIRAFGTNAYTAEQAGVDVVEPHTEDPDLAHEELYFVARGRATFTLDGERIDAPAGTYVFIPEPGVHRHAVAEEPGTTVLSFGGPATFTPSAWEWSFRAAAARDTDPALARAILDDGFAAHPGSAGLLYELARLEASQGRADEAFAALSRMAERAPHAVADARVDPALAPLHDDPRFAKVLGG